MQITIKRSMDGRYDFATVTIKDGAFCIEWRLDRDERRELAEVFQSASDDLMYGQEKE
ncbi:MAG: hypothetical protein WC565_10725 [Parcubacteria group bacterium]